MMERRVNVKGHLKSADEDCQELERIANNRNRFIYLVDCNEQNINLFWAHVENTDPPDCCHYNSIFANIKFNTSMC